MESQHICDGALLSILLWASVWVKRQHPMAISHSHSHTLWLLCTLPAHRILSVPPVQPVVPLKLSSISANRCCPEQGQSASLSQSTLVQFGTCFFGLETVAWKKTCPGKINTRAHTHTLTNCFSLHSPIHGLLQIAPLFANESLEGCTLQSFSSDAITASVPSMRWVKPLP